MSIPFVELNSFTLFPLGNKENKVDSCVSIQFEDAMRNGKPFDFGVNDSHQGSTSHEWLCGTCEQDKRLCPGHYGAINLNYPVLSPMFVKEIIKWLKVICFKCGKVIIPIRKLPIRKDRILTEYVKLATRATNKNMICVHCEALHPHITKDKHDPISIIMEIYDVKTTNDTKGQLLERRPLYPHQIKKIFKKILPSTVVDMGKPVQGHPKKYILSVLRTPPNPIRPDIKKITGGRSSSNDLTILLQTIVKVNNDMPNIIPEEIDQNTAIKIHNLNLAVYDLIRGSSSTAKRSIVNNSKKPLNSISKNLPRKYGRIRRNLMGRRVMHTARSFITCDPFIRIYEVGVPVSIAHNIQFAETVREYNYNQMLIYFMNGLKRYPGATKVKKASDGKTYSIDKVKSLEIGDVLHRDIITGDYLGFNRQPSLENCSLSAMRAVVLEKGESFRINLSACNFFGADFDGDAMNGIFAMTYRVMNEITSLASPEQSFTTYKNGSPRVGEAHDSLVGISELTRSATRVDKYHAHQLLRQINIFPDLSKYPADYVFSGREIFTIYLKESGNLINYTGVPSFYKENQLMFRSYDPSEIKIEIDRGELKSGVLDKASIGEGAHGGLFHIIFGTRGPKAALDAAFDISTLANNFLFHRGFTVSMRDILLKETGLEEIYRVEKTIIAESLRITEDLNHGKIIPPIGKTIEEYYEELQINALNPGDAYWRYILGSIDPDYNCLYKMVSYGSRGKLENFKNISSAVGQLEINGERMAEKFAGRTLPYFSKYDSDPASRGYIGNSYLSGMNLTEFIFHSMEARYALINKALSTSITGTYNRMAIKNLESLIVDNQFKTSDGGRVVQLVYGANASDPRFIEKVSFPTMKKELSDAKFEQEFHAKAEIFDKEFHNKGVQKVLDEEFEQLKRDRDWYRNLFLNFETMSGKVYNPSASMPVNINRIIEDTLYNLELKKFKPKKVYLDPLRTVEKVRALCQKIVYCMLNEIQEKNGTPPPDYLTQNSILLQVLIRSYLNCAFLVKKNIVDEALDIIIDKIKITYLKSLVSYGKAVGIIGAQSISEPMTQNVLDSHQFSGISSTKKKGLFRVREILGVRPTEGMKAPSMTINVLPEYQKNKPKVQEIANHIEMLKFQKFVKNWQIFFEKYGNPVHPAYKHEKKMIEEFEKYNIHIKPPSDLANWCVRFDLNKSIMIEKQMKIETIYFTLRKIFPAIHIVYSSDNAREIIMRIYFRNTIAKKGQITTNQIKELASEILNTTIRGIEGINACYVQEVSRTRLKDDGSLASEPIYFIFTAGTNLEGVLENDYIDPNTTHSDSIVEIFNVCGINAARDKIIGELRYQIEGIDFRNYAIYADQMVWTGALSSIDRYGSSKRGSSILLRISDASPLNVIEDATINCLSDNLNGVSPPIMLGQNPKIGDLYNSFVLDEEFVASKVKDLSSILEEL